MSEHICGRRQELARNDVGKADKELARNALRYLNAYPADRLRASDEAAPL